MAALEPQEVLYCGVCGLPPEYCEFRSDFDKCKGWIREHCPEVYPAEVLAGSSASGASTSKPRGGSGTEEIEEKVSELNVGEEGDEADKKKEKKVKSKEKKKKEINSKVVFSLVTRNKRKYVTIVTGIDSFEGIKAKDASKKFGKKFSSGCSVSESATGETEIHIQGDVTYELPEVLETLFGIPPEKIFQLENGKEVCVA